jgi:hypothetical protein
MKKKDLKELVKSYSEDIKALDHAIALLEQRVELLLASRARNGGSAYPPVGVSRYEQEDTDAPDVWARFGKVYGDKSGE